MASHRNKIYRQLLSTAHDARAKRTRESLRDALLLLLETIPIEQIGIRDIAVAAGVGYATFYRHYQTKEALLTDIAAAEVQSLIQLALPIMNVTNSRDACRSLFELADQRRKVWLVLLAGGAASALREELLNTALEVAATWPAEPLTLPPPDVRTRLLVGGVIEILAWWLRDPSRPSVDAAAEVLSRVVVAPALSQAAELPASARGKSPVPTAKKVSKARMK